MKNNYKPCDSCGGKTEIGIDETDLTKAPGYTHPNGKGLLCETCFFKFVAVQSRFKGLNDEDKQKLIDEHFRRRQKRWGNMN